MKFFETSHCTSRRHCKTCRDVDAVYWRTGIAEAFDVGGKVNFDCPYGVPWSNSADQAPVASPSVSVRFKNKSYNLKIPGDFVAWLLSKWFKYDMPSCNKCMKMRAEINSAGWAKSIILLPSYLPKMIQNYRNIIRVKNNCISRRNK